VLFAFPSFFRSVRTSLRNNPLLNVNSTTGAFYFGNITSLLQLIEKFGENRPVNQIHNFINKFRVKTTFREASQKFIKDAKEKEHSSRESLHGHRVAQRLCSTNSSEIDFEMTDDRNNKR
jgi:hypothetical protein